MQWHDDISQCKNNENKQAEREETLDSIQLGNFYFTILSFYCCCKDYNDERWANDTKSKKGETSGIRMT